MLWICKQSTNSEHKITEFICNIESTSWRFLTSCQAKRYIIHFPLGCGVVPYLKWNIVYIECGNVHHLHSIQSLHYFDTAYRRTPHTCSYRLRRYWLQVVFCKYISEHDGDWPYRTFSKHTQTLPNSLFLSQHIYDRHRVQSGNIITWSLNGPNTHTHSHVEFEKRRALRKTLLRNRPTRGLPLFEFNNKLHRPYRFQ